MTKIAKAIVFWIKEQSRFFTGLGGIGTFVGVVFGQLRDWKVPTLYAGIAAAFLILILLYFLFLIVGPSRPSAEQPAHSTKTGGAFNPPRHLKASMPFAFAVVMALIAISLFFGYWVFGWFGSSTAEAIRSTKEGGAHSVMPAPRLQVKQEPSPVTCLQTDAAREEPIRAIFRAWETLDVNLYDAQWTPDALQYFGRGRVRDLQGIIAARETTFAKLRMVKVQRVNISYISSDSAASKYRGFYDLLYYFKNGSTLRDTNLEETYLVVCDESSGRWKIKINDDRK